MAHPSYACTQDQLESGLLYRSASRSGFKGGVAATDGGVADDVICSEGVARGGRSSVGLYPLPSDDGLNVSYPPDYLVSRVAPCVGLMMCL